MVHRHASKSSAIITTAILAFSVLLASANSRAFIKGVKATPTDCGDDMEGWVCGKIADIDNDEFIARANPWTSQRGWLPTESWEEHESGAVSRDYEVAGNEVSVIFSQGFVGVKEFENG